MTQTLLAATAPERIGFFIAGIMIVAWLVYVFVTSRHRDPDEALGSEIELAPNRKPYANDEALEGPRLERALGWALVLMVVAAIGPLVYWLNEPSRQAGAVDEFDRKSIERGRQLFLPTDSPEHGAHFGCAECHGPKGEGGVTQYNLTLPDGSIRTVQWAAPAVDTALLKFSAEEVRQILVYGRANTPMPAWGIEGGGPMNDQQINDLVAYMGSLTISDEEAQQRSLQEARTQAALDGTSASDGATLFKTNCARCHTNGWSYGDPEVQGGGAFGPNLTGGVTTRQFPDIASMIEFISIGSEYGKPYGVRGQGDDAGGGMPGFGPGAAGTNDSAKGILTEAQIKRFENSKGVLTEAQIRAIVEYERGL